MNKSILALTCLALCLQACGSTGGATPSAAATDTEAPKTAAEVQEALMAEWQPAYDRATVLVQICLMANQTQRAFSKHEINLERALSEQQAEIDFIHSTIESTSPTDPPSSIRSRLKRLEAPTAALLDVLESGQDSLRNAAVTLHILDTCGSLVAIQKDIVADAQTAGLTAESLEQMDADVSATNSEVMALMTGRGSVALPTVPKPTVPPPTATLAVAQEPLKDEWRPAYNDAMLLFETCVNIVQTHADYRDGVIGLDRAETELEAEGDFVGYVLQGIASSAAPSDAVAPHMAFLDEKGYLLADVLAYRSDAIGAPETLDELYPLCSSLEAKRDAIIGAARAAGMSDASFGELIAEIDPMIEDLYNQTIWGR